MKPDNSVLIDECEAVLASHIVELTTEFRSYEVADLISFIRLGRSPSLHGLINSDCEALFRPATMTFGGDADVVVTWHSQPTIHLAMEFRHHGFEIFYRVTLTAADACVEIDLLRFSGPGGLKPGMAADLDRVLSDARFAACT